MTILQTARELATEFADLAGGLEHSEDLTGVLREVAALARRRVPRCDAASVMMQHRGRAGSLAATDPRVTRAEWLHYSREIGPALEAMRYGEPRRVDDTTTETRWPRFVADMHALGFRSALSLPIHCGPECDSVVNLYSRRPGAFAGTVHDIALLFAAEGGIALAHADVYHAARRLVDQLQQALATRGVIEQAKGILMARDGISAPEAFDVLRRRSQREHRKLRDVAADVVEALTEEPAAD